MTDLQTEQQRFAAIAYAAWQGMPVTEAARQLAEASARDGVAMKWHLVGRAVVTELVHRHPGWPDAMQPGVPDDAMLEACIEHSDGTWTDDQFRIDGPGLMSLLRHVAAVAAPAPPELVSAAKHLDDVLTDLPQRSGFDKQAVHMPMAVSLAIRRVREAVVRVKVRTVLREHDATLRDVLHSLASKATPCRTCGGRCMVGGEAVNGLPSVPCPECMSPTLNTLSERGQFDAAGASQPASAADLSRQDAAATVPELVAALKDLREVCGGVSPFANAVAVKASVLDIRRVGKFMEACERADAVLAKLEGGA